MQPFVFERADSPDAALRAATAPRAASSALSNPTQYLAGGTTLLDLMKLEVMRPRTVVDINGLADGALGRIEPRRDGVRLGALVRMADAADDPTIRRQCPMIAQSLALAASQQIRNMASLGGNVLQRTRCAYFRDVFYAACNKRVPGSGCAAMNGINREHAVLGTSEQCIATYPGDFAQALIALDAGVEIAGTDGSRTISRCVIAPPTSSRWPPAPWRSTSATGPSRMRASRSAASRRCRGARGRPNRRCAARRSTTRPLRRPRIRPSRRRAAASTIPSRSPSAGARWRARCGRPPRSRSERRFVMASAAAPEPKANMGAPAPRIDGRLKVTGEARYPADMALDNPAFAVLVTSRIAKGRLTGLDIDAARAVPGVLDILTHENTGDLKNLKFQNAGSATSIQSLGPDIFHDGQ